MLPINALRMLFNTSIEVPNSKMFPSLGEPLLNDTRMSQEVALDLTAFIFNSVTADFNAPKREDSLYVTFYGKNRSQQVWGVTRNSSGSLLSDEVLSVMSEDEVHYLIAFSAYVMSVLPIRDNNLAHLVVLFFLATAWDPSGKFTTKQMDSVVESEHWKTFQKGLLYDLLVYGGSITGGIEVISANKPMVTLTDGALVGITNGRFTVDHIVAPRRNPVHFSKATLNAVSSSVFMKFLDFLCELFIERAKYVEQSSTGSEEVDLLAVGSLIIGSFAAIEALGTARDTQGYVDQGFIDQYCRSVKRLQKNGDCTFILEKMFGFRW